MLDDHELEALEREAVELATLAGARVTTGFGRALAVRYKGSEAGEATYRDPVSEVDQDVEAVIRAQVAARFPGHDVLGEEDEARPGRGHDVVWAVDPVDGTANFVNGFPLFSASIGVLWRGQPVVGAVWCSTSHALRPGVYHARRGGALGFDSDRFEPAPNPGVRRRLIGLGWGLDADWPWDVRKSGSAALECAFVAAGLLEAARFEAPNVWDVAGGIPLVQAAGGTVHADVGAGWRELESFAAEDRDLRDWRGRVILGRREAVEVLCERSS